MGLSDAWKKWQSCQGTRPTSNWTPCYRINSILKSISQQEKLSTVLKTQTHGSHPVKLKAPSKTLGAPPEVVDKLFMKIGSHGQCGLARGLRLKSDDFIKVLFQSFVKNVRCD